MGNGKVFNWGGWWISLSLLYGNVWSYTRPNIVFIMVDDMGWNDVSYHGSDQILTPNIDALATRGIVLQQYYSEAICTPARSALLTGKYPMRTGMYGIPLVNSEDRGIPLTERLLPAYLKDLGYSTHLVGKWHFPGGMQYFGLDMYDGDVPQDEEERYSVDALTDRAISIIQKYNESRPMFLHLAHNTPHAGNEGGLLQPPLHSPVKSQHIANSNRRLYAEMVRHLDCSIGRVVTALADKGILQDTIITFMSDNGAPTVGQFNNWGVNLPFRGKKQTPWEGAVRVPAFIWHSSFKPRVWRGLMHITDWMPTLLAAAGGELTKDIDGVNQWDAIVNDGKSQRKDVLISFDDSVPNTYASYRLGDYKIIVGNVSGLSNGYYGANFMANKAPPPDYFAAIRSSEVAKVFESYGICLDYDEVIKMRKASTIKQLDRVQDLIPCEPTPTRGCLYNVLQDPSEGHDLWERGIKVATLLTSRLRALWSQRVRRVPTVIDPRSDPANFGYRWLPWLNDTVLSDNQNDTTSTQSVSASEQSLLPNSNSAPSDRTVASVIGCDNPTGFMNFLCVLRSVV
ncbi:arylsulfatase B-like isoform X2 [Maniola hyperantus]|uniref:arylsulfatase B-like isoform X2 n=1 Tax=Aphantopus hyperantus TaxID=2795564 RepID=UPI00374802EE